MTLSRFFTIGLAIGLVMTLILAAIGCSETPTTPAAPTPVVVAPTPVPEPVVTPPAPVVEAFCPYPGFDNFRITESKTGVFQFTWDVQLSPKGEYLKRYQIRVVRSGNEFAFLEAQVDRLSGPHNRRATFEWAFPGNDPGAIAGQIRVHYAGLCREDGSGNVRANGPWSTLVGAEN